MAGMFDDLIPQGGSQERAREVPWPGGQSGGVTFGAPAAPTAPPPAAKPPGLSFDDLIPAQTQPKLREEFQRPTFDFRTGADPALRALLGGIYDIDDRLATLKKYYPESFRGTGEDLFYRDPETNTMVLVNPTGRWRSVRDAVGDVASLGREGAQIAGGTVGAALGAPGGLPGMAAGSVLGTAGGEELYQQFAQIAGAQDTRPVGDRAADTAMAGVAGLGGPAGAAAGAGVRGGAKAALRGGREGRREATRAVQDLKRFGTNPSVAQATQSQLLDGLESLLSKYPGSAGVFRQRVVDTTNRVQRGIQSMSRDLVGGATDPELAGRTIKQGIEEGFIPRFQDKSNALYGELDKYLPAFTPTPIQNYGRVLNQLAAPVPGAEASSTAIQNPALRRYLDGLLTDLGEQSIESGQLPFSAVQGLRRAIGQKLGGTDLIADVSRGELKAVYRALSQDIENAARQQGPEALKAFQRANRYYRAGIGRVDDFLEPLAKKVSPEDIFLTLERGAKNGPTRIRAVMKSLSPDERKAVVATMLQRLGRARSSQQNAAGNAFSFETFLTRWNDIDAKAKDALFNQAGMQGTRADLDRIARAAERMRESSQAFFNPAGTAGSAAGLTMLGGGLASGATGLATGSEAALMFPVALAGVSALANATARLMTNRGFVRWLASGTKVKPRGFGDWIGRLGAVAANSSIEDRQAIRQLLDFMNLPEPVDPDAPEPEPEPEPEPRATVIPVNGD